MKITIDKNERKFMILILKHIQECPSHKIPQGIGIRPMAFMLSNKLFGRGYKEGDWNKHMKKLVDKKMKEFEPTWKMGK